MTDDAAAAPGPDFEFGVDPVTIDLVENALKSIRREMDAVVFRTAMSPIIREEHDAFPLVSDREGRMIVGQFGWDIGATLFKYFPKEDMREGDVIIQNDPYLCGGAIQHTPDMLVARPFFYDGELIGLGSIFGNLADIGTAVAGSMPTAAKSIFEEGIRFPPIKLYDAGVLNKPVLDILALNTRLPDMNVADIMALSASLKLAETRVIELCERFGKETYIACTDALLERTRRAMKRLIRENIPEHPQSFEDYIDDDGRGNGPFKMKLTYFRDGDRAVFDWTGTSAQAPGPINLMLSEGMFKIDIGVYLIMVYDPDILFNQGYYDLIDVILPKKSLVQPEFPAPLSNRSHTLARKYDVISGALGQNTPALTTAASFGSSPHFLFSGTDSHGHFFHLVEILYGGLAGRPLDDGIDGHSWWPQFENIPSEYLESYYPLRIEHYRCAIDSGGAGLHRGGTGIEKRYRFLESGSVSLHDDRHISQPWGLGGGKPGASSSKTLIHADGRQEKVASKIDDLMVEPGDELLFVTAGGGGWGDPLERPYDKVRQDVARTLVSEEKAREDYGVVFIAGSLEVDAPASDGVRAAMRKSRGDLLVIDRGPLPASYGAGS